MEPAAVRGGGESGMSTWIPFMVGVVMLGIVFMAGYFFGREQAEDEQRRKDADNAGDV